MCTDEVSLPTVASYQSYTNPNYGAHAIGVSLEGLELWFSYHTLIGFQFAGEPQVLSKNIWGPTTAGHLRAIGGKFSLILPRDEFAKRFREQFVQWRHPTLSDIAAELKTLIGVAGCPPVA